jgi:hypothetical protein
MKMVQCYLFKRNTKQSQTITALVAASGRKNFPLPVDLIRELNKMLPDDEFVEWYCENFEDDKLPDEAYAERFREFVAECRV